MTRDYLTTMAFWAAAAARSIRTTAQATLALIGTATLFHQVGWLVVFSGAGMAGVLSILTSIATGLPEVDPPVGAGS